MVWGTNGCEGVNIVILSVVHLSKFGCFFSVVGVVSFVLFLSCPEQLQVVLLNNGVF